MKKIYEIDGKLMIKKSSKLNFKFNNKWEFFACWIMFAIPLVNIFILLILLLEIDTKIEWEEVKPNCNCKNKKRTK